MKFNKKNFNHYFIFISYSIIFSIAFILSLFIKKNNNKIFLIGHRFEGNLESFVKLNHLEYDFVYLTFSNDAAEANKYANKYLNILNIIELLNAKVIISTHGILFHRLIKLRKIVTINIGHGVQTSNVDISNSELNLFNEVWLCTQLEKDVLINDCGYLANNLKVTGFVKHQEIYYNNLIINQETSKSGNHQSYWLYAPTAFSNNKNHKQNLFNIKNPQFIEKLNELSVNNECITIIKPHYYNLTKNKEIVEIKNMISSFSNLIYIDEVNLDTNKFLSNLTDVLITDWSSIYLDYLIIDKPIIFLNSSKRRNKINVSRYLENDFIYRVNSYEDLNELQNKSFKTPNKRLKKFVFGNLDPEKINETCNQRLGSMFV